MSWSSHENLEDFQHYQHHRVSWDNTVCLPQSMHWRHLLLFEIEVGMALSEIMLDSFMLTLGLWTYCWSYHPWNNWQFLSSAFKLILAGKRTLSPSTPVVPHVWLLILMVSLSQVISFINAYLPVYPSFFLFLSYMPPTCFQRQQGLIFLLNDTSFWSTWHTYKALPQVTSWNQTVTHEFTQFLD